MTTLIGSEAKRRRSETGTRANSVQTAHFGSPLGLIAA